MVFRITSSHATNKSRLVQKLFLPLKATILLSVLFLVSCDANNPQQGASIFSSSRIADSVMWNGHIYTVDDTQPTVEAIAIKNGSILATGSRADIEKLVGEKTQIIDLNGRTATPGLWESHAHLTYLGQSLNILSLEDVHNYQELVDKVAAAAANRPAGEWILGHGWHQSKWAPPASPLVQGFQTHDLLSAAVPDHPVILRHASGHAVFVNKKAMELAGIDAQTTFSGDGEVVKDANGEPTGILNENAQQLIAPFWQTDKRQDILLGMQEALRNGITSFDDAGTSADEIAIIQALGEEGKLPIRLYLMLSSDKPALLDEWFKRGPLRSAYDDHLTIRAIKVYADGALGSRGAWLLEPYSDMPGHSGTPITDAETIYNLAKRSLAANFQMNTHAIGDRANRVVLDEIEKAMSESIKTDTRFRIEHAQHISADDIPRFAKLGVIASIQSIHMSSDRPWAIDRLGAERIEEGAYVWQKLMQSGAVVVNGTDAPVEPINPIANFYAAVTRKTLDGKPEGGYEADQAMTREQALKSYTLNAAFAAFAEKRRGSLTPGKQADITVFNQDIMTVAEKDLLATKVDFTIVAGELRYQRQ